MLDVVRKEVDGALGVLIGTACDLLVSHARFMIGLTSQRDQ